MMHHTIAWNLPTSYNNLCETLNTPNSNTTFKGLAITWYRDLFINHETADDETGVTNGIFEAFGIPVAMFEMEEEYLGWKMQYTIKIVQNQWENSLVINKGVYPSYHPDIWKMKM